MLHELPITLFLFAHQDDEFGVFAVIESVIRRGGRPVCIYMTDGAGGGAVSAVRNAESLAVLTGLGVDRDDLHFVGTEESIPDGQLVAHLDHAELALCRILERLGPVTRIVMHAWEGGHQDHDAVHLLGLAIAKDRGILGNSQQFALYRRLPGSLLPFVLFRPLAANGPVLVQDIPLRRSFRYLGLMFQYRSQLKSMIGLWPMAVHHYLFRGQQLLQPVNLDRTRQAPHPGLLLYESRAKVSYAHFCKCSAAFRDRHRI